MKRVADFLLQDRIEPEFTRELIELRIFIETSRCVILAFTSSSEFKCCRGNSGRLTDGTA